MFREYSRHSYKSFKDNQAKFSAYLKASKKLHFVRSGRGLQNFLAIPIMNPLAGFMIVGYDAGRWWPKPCYWSLD